MATAGNLISKSNFSTSWAQTWSDAHGNKDQTRYVFICAPTWWADAWASYYILGNSGIVQLYFSYWNGTAWSSEWHYEISGVNGSTGDTYFAHNWSNGSLRADFSNEYPLWRIRYWPSRNNSNWGLHLYAGSWGLAKDSSGNFMNYPQGKKIYSIGRTGTNVNIHAAGTTDDSDKVVNSIFNPKNRTGSPILASCDHELINVPYL